VVAVALAAIADAAHRMGLSTSKIEPAARWKYPPESPTIRREAEMAVFAMMALLKRIRS
jgi:hypothetical protein